MASSTPYNSNVLSPVADKAADDQFFKTLIAQVKADQELIAKTSVSAEIKQRYSDILAGDENDLAALIIEPANRNLVRKFVFDYWTEVKAIKSKLKKLGLALDHSDILVWAEIDDSDKKDSKETQRMLLRLEGRLNNKYYSKGFSLSTMIVETSDEVSAPNYYYNLLD